MSLPSGGDGGSPGRTRDSWAPWSLHVPLAPPNPGEAASPAPRRQRLHFLLWGGGGGDGGENAALALSLASSQCQARPKASADTAPRVLKAHLGVVAHDVVETGQEAQAGTDLHVHGSIHVVEQVQGLIDELAALLQEACRAPPRVAKSGPGQGIPLPLATPSHAPCCTLACPLWKKWKASEAMGLTCLTTGKMFSTSSSVKAGLWRLSKLYSFSRTWGIPRGCLSPRLQWPAPPNPPPCVESERPNTGPVDLVGAWAREGQSAPCLPGPRF